MYLVSTFDNEVMSGSIYYGNLRYTIQGKLKRVRKCSIAYRAAAPGDLRLSYAGSGLPFATSDQAYHSTPNQGAVGVADDGSFELCLLSPNSYYVCQGVHLIKPHVHLDIHGMLQSEPTESVDLQLGTPIPNRSLRHLTGRPNRTYGR